MPVMSMVHTVDPVDEIINKIGDLSEFEIPLNKVLIGIYMRPSKTKGGIELPDNYRDEDFFQGKAGLVLKKGPLAFQDDDVIKFNGFNPDVGDWVAFKPSNGLKIDIRDKEGHCILLKDTQIELIIPAPDIIF